MKSPEALVEELMVKVRAALFKRLPPQAWFTQQGIVKRALTYPAAYLDQRKVEISAERYEAILEGILKTILAHGRSSLGPRPSAYLYTCIERHMAIHGDEYYREGVVVRNHVNLTMRAVEKVARGADATVPILAKVHAVLDVGKRKAKIKTVAATMQTDLFANAKPGSNCESSCAQSPTAAKMRNSIISRTTPRTPCVSPANSGCSGGNSACSA